MKTNTSTLAIGIGIVLLGAWFVWRSMSASDGSNDVAQPSDAMQAVELVGTNWNVVAITGAPPVTGTTPFVQFGADGRLSGSDGCNNFSTGYTVDGDQVQIDPAMISTKMACEPAVMEQADQVTELLLATTSYAISGEELSLKQADGVGFILIATQNDLADTAWTVTSYNNGNQAVVSPITDTTLTIAFGSDGSLSGTSGCNTYFGTFEADASIVSIGSVGGTEMFCETPEGVMDQEAAFLAALPTAATWQIMGNQLWIRSAEDAIVIIASPAEITQQ